MTTPDVTAAQLAALNGSDPVAASSAAVRVAQQNTAPYGYKPPTDIEVVVYDRFYQNPRTLGNYIDLKASMPRLKLPQAQLTVMGTDPIVPSMLDCWQTVVPVTITLNGTIRWSGRVDVAHDKRNTDGTEVVECQLIGDLTMLDRILVWPHPFLPIETQPSEAIYIGPAITVLKTMVAENVLRLQLGLWEIIDALGTPVEWLAWENWFGALLADDAAGLSMTEAITTPVCVIFTDPLLDTSPWIFLHGRMDTCWKLMLQQLQDNGLYASMDLWLPGDPQPEGVAFPLKVATYVFNIRDYSGVTGPTGTVIDGLVEDLVDFGGSILGGVLQPFLNPNNEYVPPGSNIVIAPALGVNFVPPWVVFDGDANDNGVVSMDIAYHHVLCWQLVMGGRSPQWLNDLLNAFFEFIIDIFMMLIGITGISDTLLDGILDNAFLAFEVFENTNLRIQLGPYGFPEKFFPLSSTYNIDSLFAAITAMWDTRGYPAAQFTFTDGEPYTLGVDLFPGAMASIVRRGTLYTDYVDEIEITDSVDARGKLSVQVGDGRREDSPMLIAQRKLVGLEEDLMLALLAPPSN